MIRERRHTPALATLLLAAAAMLPAAAPAQKQVLRLRLDGPVIEAPLPNAELMALFGGPVPQPLRQIVSKIHKAADDPQISGMAMIIEQPVMNFAQLEEIADALRDFRKSGKKVYCYLDYADNLTYALAAAGADHITLAENSELDIPGLSMSVSFYKGLLDKLGIEAQGLHCGAYKAAGEPFTRTAPSKEFAENLNWLLDGLFDRWLTLIAEGRGLSRDKVRELIDHGLWMAEDAQQAGLVDAVGSFDDFRRRIRKQFGEDVEVVKKYPRKTPLDLDLDPSNPFAMFSQFNKLMEQFFGAPARGEEPGLGLIYVDGVIAVGQSRDDGLAGRIAGSTTIRAALQKAREDDRIRAVVLRVDSPGGSAIASDIIWKAATALAREKPLIVSMGGVAASGGYYVSCPGDVIFAEPQTLTASIGVVSVKFSLNRLLEDKLGITTTEFKRGKHADLMSLTRPWTDEEQQLVFDWMNRVYEQFKRRVRTARGDRLKTDLEKIAGGRVFTGKQALEYGLVDRLGGLSDALKLAAEKAGLPPEAPVYVLPEPEDFFKVLARAMGEETEDEWEIRTLGRLAGPQTTGLLSLMQAADATVARTLGDALIRLRLLSRERAVCILPAVPVVR